MAFTKLTPVLPVEDVDAAVSWYTEMLDFHVESLVPGAVPNAFAILHNGDVEVMLQTRESLAEGLPTIAERPIGGSTVCFIELEGVRELWDRIGDKVTVLNGLHDTDYGMTEFYIADPNGYAIGFAEPTGAGAVRSDDTEAAAPAGFQPPEPG
jgi:catechol 2,3-dioxygenase-like lactoylglutathione lyase family enzyme